MRTLARDPTPTRLMVLEPRSRLAAARDVAIIVLCAALLLAVLLVVLGDASAPASAPAAEPATRSL